MRSPRIVKGFRFEVHPNPEVEKARNDGKLLVLAGSDKRFVDPGQPVRVQFKVMDKTDKTLKSGLDRLSVLAYRAPGTWQKRIAPVEAGEGIYGITFTPPAPGVYYINLFNEDEVIIPENGQLILEAAQD